MPNVRAQLVCHSPERLPQILAGDADPKEVLTACSFYPIGWTPYSDSIILGEVDLAFNLPEKVVETAIAGVRQASKIVEAKAEKAKTDLLRIEQSLLSIGWEGQA